MILRMLATLLPVLLAFAASPSHACSLAPDAVRPSNFELVQLADAIVIATATSQYGNEAEGGVVFRVEVMLKGRPPRRLRIDDAMIGMSRPSNLVDISSPHPQSGDGACNRYKFERGRRYLLFLGRGEDGAWEQLGYPYSRINEDYVGENNPWMRTVRRYLRMQKELAPMEQVAALQRMSATGRDIDGRRLGRTERADVTAHLSALSPWNPTELLLDVYHRIERGETLETRWPAATGTPDRLLVLRYLAEGTHPGALPLFERLAVAPETRGRARGLVLRYLTGNGRYADAYRWIETSLIAELPQLGREEAIALLGDVFAVQNGDSWEAGSGRWRSHPPAVRTWPDLARRIDAWQTATFGADRPFRFADWIDRER